MKILLWGYGNEEGFPKVVTRILVFRLECLNQTIKMNLLGMLPQNMLIWYFQSIASNHYSGEPRALLLYIKFTDPLQLLVSSRDLSLNILQTINYHFLITLFGDEKVLRKGDYIIQIKCWPFNALFEYVWPFCGVDAERVKNLTCAVRFFLKCLNILGHDALKGQVFLRVKQSWLQFDTLQCNLLKTTHEGIRFLA